MKILVVTRGYPQKHNKMMGLFERDQALALQKAGHEVAYAVVDIRSLRRKRKFAYNHYESNGLRVYEMNYPLGPMPRFLIEFFRSKALSNLYSYILKDFGRPDIVHAHFLNYGVISLPLCNKEKLPLVVTEHSSYMNTQNLKPDVHKRAMKTYGAASAIISVSKALANNIFTATGHKSYVVPNIIDTDFIGKSKSNSNKNISSFCFAASGQMINRKGFDILLNAFSKVVKEYPAARLVLYGDGPIKKKLLNQTKELNLEKNVEFYGSYLKEDLPELYSNADAFVLSSRNETFGVVYIEAMALGLPVIATRCGGPEEIITEETGYLVDNDDEVGLSEAMIKMIKNIETFDRSKIIQYAQDEFSSAKVASEIADIYECVLKKEEK